jgi:F-type H+-transporting ATPase subunit gamma
MAQARDIGTQIDSLKELLEIVSALRAMAAAQVQQSQRSLEAIRNYTGIVRRALDEATTLIPADSDCFANSVRRPALVVFCSEHGFCGAFNEALITTAAQESSKEPNLQIIFVGTRGVQRAAERALPSGLTIPMATHSDGVTAVARRVSNELYRMFVEQAITSIEVIFTREVVGQHTTLHRQKLLPLEPSVSEENRATVLPIVNMTPRRLLDELAAEYMFALVEAAAMESFASENAARFRTMEGAHENISNKATELSRLARRMRQEAVTTEILDLIGGFEAMRRG